MNRLVVLLALLCTGVAVAQDYQGAVEDPGRPPSDRENDDRRKPVEVMRFAGIAPGDVVLEIGAGRGYTTELASRIVGNDGKVYAHRLDPDRLIGNRLPNVIPVPNEPADLGDRLQAAGLEPGSVDSILAFFSLHDYYLSEENDMAKIYQTLRRFLKPGGDFVVMDNTARAGSGIEDTEDLHRIDPEFLKNDILAAGFELVAESNVLRNPDDDLSSSWFEDTDKRPAGYQDRFAYKFHKP